MSVTQPNLVTRDVVDVEGADALSIQRLTLTDFRCYDFARIETGSESVVLTGPNGAGKTNILEALSMLVPGRGLRGVKFSEIGRKDRGVAENQVGRPWAVAAHVQTPEGPHDLGTGLEPNAGGSNGRDKRVVRIDGETVKAQAALSEYLSAQWLTPQMDRLFIEGTTTRRRFLDRLVFGFDPAHAGRVNAYNQAMRERMKLLSDGPADQAWLTALEETMAERGIAVAAARKDMAERLNRMMADNAGAFPSADIAITGTIEGWMDEGPALEAEERFRGVLAENRHEDGRSGTTGCGPHRSDLVVHHREKGQVAALCSTGEQKALLIAIVFANARLQTEERGWPPILLLDEVAAHLDEKRRLALFEEILNLGAQAWLTGTDKVPFEPLTGKAHFLTVHDGQVT